MAPALVIDKYDENSWYSEYFYFAGFTNLIDNSDPYVTYSIQKLSENIDCSETSIEQYLEMENTLLTFEDSINIFENTGYFHARVYLDNYSDGNYVMYIGSHNDNSLTDQLMSIECIKFRIDQTIPSVSINGLNSIVEGSENIEFDASDSIDPQWGRSDLYYIWTFTKNSSYDVTPIFIESGRELTSVKIPTNISG